MLAGKMSTKRPSTSRDAVNDIRVALLTELPPATPPDAIGVELRPDGEVWLWAEHSLSYEELGVAADRAYANGRFALGTSLSVLPAPA